MLRIRNTTRTSVENADAGAGRWEITCRISPRAVQGIGAGIHKKSFAGRHGYRGKSVYKAIDNVRKVIRPVLKGLSVFELEKIDQRMIDLDGTSNKSRLGAKAIQLTQQAGWLPVMSARSGETEDAFISHLAVVAGQYSPCRSQVDGIL
ncbi:MAG: hypothetical protein GY703_09995 [Gammaproteobacteria bacterium]|nr:hypothetical protein [Gammaproteobacteria bacterium]